ncbi:MAG: hypothetical protein IIB72_07180 [Proteobacteria bacterium]|nr:hypothetical protein [Pseudomonadota bacterium]
MSRATTEAAIQTIFEAHGAVQSTSLVLDKKSGGSKGFAVELHSNLTRELQR